MALRFSCLDRALPQGKGPLAHPKALSGAGRLFRIEAEAFRIFFQYVGNIITIPWRAAPYHYRHCWQFLRPFYRERCLYARLRTGGPLRLRYFEYRKGEQRGFAVDETLSESRYAPFPPHYFWKTILAAVQQRTGPSELIASERLQMCRAILPGTANSYDTNEFAQKIAAV